MVSFWIYLSLIAFVAIFALAATLVIGHSRENREGNPTYDRRMPKYMRNLTVFYVLAGIGVIVVFAVYVNL